MAVVTTFYPTTITWNGNTWDCTNGGPLMARYEHGGTAHGDRTGNQRYPAFVEIVDLNARVTVRLRQFKQTMALDQTSSDLTLVLTSKNTTVNFTFKTMILEDVRGGQNRAQPGDVELMFIHESDDGFANPLS